MIEILSNPPFARQYRQSPSVYLDHWAVRLFSENLDLGARFTTALRDHAGTLVMSWVNIAEFVAMNEDTEAATLAEDFIDNNWPRLFFMLAEPFEVAKREDQRRDGTLYHDPEGDNQLMNIPTFHMSPSGVISPSIRGIIKTVMTGKTQLEPSALSLKSTIARAIYQRFQLVNADAAERRKIENAPTQPHRSRATHALTELLIRELWNRRQPEQVPGNDVFDLLHAAVPMAYCDFVLLDKKWQNFAARAVANIRRENANALLATVFSGRKGEIDRFLTSLEEWNPAPSSRR
jgi:hypothetical protein